MQWGQISGSLSETSGSIVCANREGSGETAQTGMTLALVFACTRVSFVLQSTGYCLGTNKTTEMALNNAAGSCK